MTTEVTPVYTFKMSGRTSASTDGTATGIIATKTVEWLPDETLRYTDANGVVSIIPVDGPLAALLIDLFTGTGGIDAGSAGGQGHRVFGQPVLKQ